jgi:Putative beta-barrel porin 2
MRSTTSLRLLALTGAATWAFGTSALAQGDSANPYINLYSPGPVGFDQAALAEDADGAFRQKLGGFDVLGQLDILGVYEDNVFLSSKDEESGTYGVVAPGLALKLGSAKSNYLSLNWVAQIPFADSFDDDSQISHSASLLGHLTEGKSTLNGWYRFRDVRGIDSTLGSRLTKQENTLYGGYDLRLTAKTAVGAHGTYVMQDYDAGDLTDFTDVRFGPRLQWIATAKTTFFLDGHFGQVDVDGDGKTGDADYTQLDLGADTDIGATWNLKGTAGYQWREFDDSSAEKSENFVSTLTLGGGLVELVKFDLGVSSTVQPAVNQSGATILETRVEPSLSRRLFTDALVVKASVAFGWVEYEAEDAAGNNITSTSVYDGREDEYTGVTVIADWAASRSVKLGAGYAYLDSSTKGEQVGPDPLDYTANRVFVRGSYNF